MPLRDYLLRKGFLPSELPPSFTTTEFARAVARPAALPNSFQNPQPARLGKFSLARGNARFRRALGLVNPIHFERLASCIAQNWLDIEHHLRKSPFCVSTPVPSRTYTRALRPRQLQREFLLARARNRSSARILITTDVAQFYRSIYTHSIPWAFHSKAVAKRNSSPRLLGNKLDAVVRGAQDRQTVGIPIGPDTSFLMAECILAACDEELVRRFPRIKAIRFVDDYEIACKDVAEAEQIIAALEEILSSYELQTNPRKTGVDPLPTQFEPVWTSELRKFSIRRRQRGQDGDLITYVDLVTKHVHDHPDDHVVKYAIARLRSFTPARANLALCEALLSQLVVAQTGAIREWAEFLVRLHGAGLPIDVGLLGETLDRIVISSAPLGHHFETSWALWLALRFGITLSADSVSAIQKVDNAVIAILSLDALNRGLAPNLDTTSWEQRMTRKELFEEEWLLAYEANVQGWLPSLGRRDHVLQDASFGFLKTANVHFYVPVQGPVPPGGFFYGPEAGR